MISWMNISSPTFRAVLQQKVVLHFQLKPQTTMKFQLVALVAALSLIAPALASPAPAPHYDDKPAYCKLSIPIVRLLY